LRFGLELELEEEDEADEMMVQVDVVDVIEEIISSALFSSEVEGKMSPLGRGSLVSVSVSISIARMSRWREYVILTL
jgi:hypothetical protein